MKIRNRQDYLTAISEGTAPKNQAKQITRYLYFAILIFIVIYLLWYGAAKMLYIQTRGQVEAGRYVIHTPYQGVITKLFAAPGDNVQAGDKLALLHKPTSGQLNNQKDLLRTRRDIKLKEVTLSELKKRLTQLKNPRANAALSDKIININHNLRLTKNRLKQLTEQREEVNTALLKNKNQTRKRLLELSRIDPLKDANEAVKRAAMQAETETLQEKIASLQSQRDELRLAEERATKEELERTQSEVKALQEYAAELQSPLESETTLTTDIISPVDGKIMAVYKQVGEQIDAAEPLLALRTPSSHVTIHGYLPEDKILSLRRGKEVRITFADGSDDRGVIKNYYSIASPYRKKIRDGYIPIQASVLVEIVPATAEHEKRWRQYDRMDVNIRLRK